MKPYFQDDAVTIYNCDCREIMPGLGKFDLLLTDPPYGLGFQYIGYSDTRDNLVSLLSSFIPLAMSMTERQIILPGPTQIGLYPQPDWVCAMTWNTTGSFGKFGYNQWTPILCYGQDIPGFGNVNGITKSDTFRINGGGSVGFMRTGPEKEHTCPKPIGMIKILIQRFSVSGETILDPFAGSGTTGRAAKDMGRKAVLIELEEKYCEIAAKRMAQQVFDFGGDD